MCYSETDALTDSFTDASQRLSDPTPSVEGNNIGLIFRLNICAIAAPAKIGLIIWLFLPKNTENESSQQDNVHMEIEIVVSVNDSTAVTVTQENPLWQGDDHQLSTDDPFKDDFEEEHAHLIMSK
jgi:hypothetical protein